MDILQFLQTRADNLLPVTIERADNNRVICGTVCFVSGGTTTDDNGLINGRNGTTTGTASVGIAFNGRIVIIPIDKINQVF